MNQRIIKSKLAEFHVAVLATDGFEESELTEPVKALREAGPKLRSFRSSLAKFRACITILIRPGKLRSIACSEMSARRNLMPFIFPAEQSTPTACALTGGAGVSAGDAGRRQAYRCYLSRAMGTGFDGTGCRVEDVDKLPFHSRRHPQCGRPLDRPGSGRGRQLGDQPHSPMICRRSIGL